MKSLACILLLSALAVAADVSGKYSGTFSSTRSDGQASESGVLVILKQNGTEISGSGGPDEGRQYPIRNGKIAGAKITGEAVNPDGPVYKLNLTVSGDKLSGDIEISVPGGGVQKATLNVTRLK